MEIDRNVKPSAPTPKPPEEPPAKETNRGRKNSWLVFDTVAKIALQGYLFTITATWYLGMFEVMPVLYKDSGEDVLFLQRCFMTLIFAEAMANWVCIRYVDSSYFWLLKRKRKQNKHNVEKGGENTNSFIGKNSHGNKGSSFSRAGDSNDESRCQGDGVNLGQEQSVLNIGHDPDSDWKPPFNPPPGTSFPYWSWVPCYICEVMRPPRCHHCPVCQTCVLKRDHHCYFAGSCVGWRNQRHFIVFLVWVGIGAIYATRHSIPFFRQELWDAMHIADVIFPVCIVRWLFGYVSGLTCICVVVQTFLVYFILLITSFVYEHISLIISGKTSFEVSSLASTIEIRDIRKIGAKFRGTLGRQWFLNFLFPVHWIFEVEEDPENWPSITVFRHGKKHTATRR